MATLANRHKAMWVLIAPTLRILDVMNVDCDVTAELTEPRCPREREVSAFLPLGAVQVLPVIVTLRHPKSTRRGSHVEGLA
jgi:hypothetical protein